MRLVVGGGDCYILLSSACLQAADHLHSREKRTWDSQTNTKENWIMRLFLFALRSLSHHYNLTMQLIPVIYIFLSCLKHLTETKPLLTRQGRLHVR